MPHFHQGEFAEAVRSYERAVRMDANITEYHRELAQVYLTEGYIRQAIEQLKHAKEPGILLALGDAYLAEEHYSSTIKEYRELLETQPDLEIARAQLGVTSGRTHRRGGEGVGRFTSAIVICEAVLIFALGEFMISPLRQSV